MLIGFVAHVCFRVVVVVGSTTRCVYDIVSLHRSNNRQPGSYPESHNRLHVQICSVLQYALMSWALAVVVFGPGRSCQFVSWHWHTLSSDCGCVVCDRVSLCLWPTHRERDTRRRTTDFQLSCSDGFDRVVLRALSVPQEADSGGESHQHFHR
jgi:hypothetical protein